MAVPSPWVPRWGARRASTAGGTPVAPPRVQLITRDGCHLCDQAAEVVAAVCADHAEAYQVIDVDTDPALRARWTDLVPVVLVDGRQVATWRVAAADLEAALDDPRRPGKTHP